ncbi:MAG: AraC family transcriptional regulator [Chloroflexota bacterium]
MPKVRVTKTMMADHETSFLTMVASSESRNWEGIFAFHARLGVVDFDLAPVGEWSVENFVLQTSQNPVTLATISSERTQTGISAPAKILDQQLRDAMDFIHANYQHDLLLSEIAASAHLSVAHFSRLFRKATGYSPHQYLIQCRIERAYSLFQQRRYTTAEIAQSVGFYDESHLLRHFKRTYGTTPAKLFL